MCANKQEVDAWFRLYEQILRDTGIMDEYGDVDGSRVWNVDETGFSDVPDEVKVVSFKYMKPWRIVPHEHGTLSTVLTYVNAAGECLEPMVIHKGQRLNPEWSQFAHRGVEVRASDTGYIKGHLFDDYAQIFVKWLRDNGRLENGKKHVVLLDGHNSHIFNINFIEYMVQSGIEVLAIPAHTSHEIQPLDGAPFANLKTKWFEALAGYYGRNYGKLLPKTIWFTVFNQAWYATMNKRNIIAGFKMTGMVPVNRAKIPDKALAPSETTDNPDLAPGAAEDSEASSDEESAPSANNGTFVLPLKVFILS